MLLDGDQSTILATDVIESSTRQQVATAPNFVKIICKNQQFPKEVFNACEVTFVADPEEGNGLKLCGLTSACCSMMIRGAKNQLARGRELRDRTSIPMTGAVTTSAKKNLAQQVQKRQSQASSQQSSVIEVFQEENKTKSYATPNKDAVINGNLDQIMEDEIEKQGD